MLYVFLYPFNMLAASMAVYKHRERQETITRFLQKHKDESSC